MSVTYDYENRLTQATVGGVVTQYVYNGDGARVKKTVSGTPTYYVGNWYEVTNGVVTKYYYFGSQRVAMKQGSTVTYLHGDHLGSTSVASTQTGTMASRQTYYAFGVPRTTEGTLPTDYTFTGQKNDASSALMFYNARYYDAAIGRFIQADTIVPDAHISRLSSLTVNFSNPIFLEELGREYRGTPKGLNVVQWFQEPTNRPGLQPSAAIDPQNLNRYAYVRNNPLRYVDPSGYWTFGVGLAITGGLGLGGTGSIMVVFDDNGHVGIALGTGGGLYGGLGGSAGFAFQKTDADTIQDLKGNSVVTGGSLDLGLSVGPEWVAQKGPTDTNPDGPINGFNVNVGFGIDFKIYCPVETHGFAEYTWIIDEWPQVPTEERWTEPVLWP